MEDHILRRVLSCIALLFLISYCAQAQTSRDATNLTELLNRFLAGASINDARMHDRFWADDLIYTGSSGRRIGKADMMKGLRSAPAPKPDDPKTTYAAEDIRIHQYGLTAVLAFRLVATTESAGTTQVARFLNTGTFRKRNGIWKVVSWQATRVPPSDEEAKNDIASAVASLHRAVLASDVKTLELLLDESFVWTHRNGEQRTRKELVEALASGKLKYSVMETRDFAINNYGETAVIRGTSTRQRSAIPAGGKDDEPFTEFYTLTFVRRDGVWKAVALHSSR